MGRLGSLGLAILALLGCGAPGILVPTNGLLRNVHIRGLGTIPVVALTFDDGPNGRCTAEVLDALAETNTVATFFVLGQNVDRGNNAALLAAMARAGHAIGIHGWAHSTSPLLTPGWISWELADAREAVKTALTHAGIDAALPRFYRPPYGMLTGPVARAVEAAGLEVVEWTVSVEDWRPGLSAADISRLVLELTRPGDVIVLHDGFETSQQSIERCVDRQALAGAIRLLVPGLAARGLRVAPLAEVLGIPAAALTVSGGTP